MGIRILALTVALTAACATGRADELSPDTIINSFDRGGKVMWAILFVSMVGCAFVAERVLSIRRAVQIPKQLMADLRDAMVSGGVAAGRQVVDGDRSAMGRVMYALLSRSGATRRELETTVDEEGSRILYDLRANLRPIGVVASISPLLGLLGTVFGLIAAFRTAAELGMDDPRNFAAGIYEALYTTAFGLVVAIPMLVVYHMLRNRADNIMREVEERALAFISAASGKAERPQRQGRGGGESARRPGSTGHAAGRTAKHDGIQTGTQRPVRTGAEEAVGKTGSYAGTSATGAQTATKTAPKTAVYDTASERLQSMQEEETRADDEATDVDEK